jgi:hypothetical protein
MRRFGGGADVSEKPSLPKTRSSAALDRLTRAWWRYGIVLRFDVAKQHWTAYVVDTYEVDNTAHDDTFQLQAGAVAAYTGSRRDDAVNFCCREIARLAEHIDDPEDDLA